MGQECDHIRNLLSRYLKGHLFQLQRSKVERHLADCPVCRSELDARRRAGETREFLMHLEPERRAARTVRAGASAVVRLLYRPLLLVLIVAAVAVSYMYIIDPILHDPELENLDAGPLASAPQAPAEAVRSIPAATSFPAQIPEPEARKAQPPAPDPLVITLTIEKEREKESIRRINDAMQEHAVLRTMQFSERVREAAGSLTAEELYTFFSRIQGTAKVAYKRSRLASAAGSELVPVVLKLQAVAAPLRQEAAPTEQQPGGNPSEKPLEKTGNDR